MVEKDAQAGGKWELENNMIKGAPAKAVLSFRGERKKPGMSEPCRFAAGRRIWRCF